MSEQTYSASAELVTALRYKKAGGNRQWDEREDARYFLSLVKHWDTELIEAVTTRIEFHEEWRPDAARLYAIAAEIASPLPCQGRLWEELYFRCNTLQPARWEQTGPDLWRKIPLPERWSHPILADIVQELGGMRFLRGLHLHEEETGIVSGWKNRFDRAHERATNNWRTAVIDALRLPRADREARLFRNYAPWAGGKLMAPTTEHVEPQHLAALAEHMPEHLSRDVRANLAKLARIGKWNRPQPEETAEVTQSVSLPAD